MKPDFTKKELEYLQMVLIQHRDIQVVLEKKQDKEYAAIRNKLTNYFRTIEGKQPL